MTSLHPFARRFSWSLATSCLRVLVLLTALSLMTPASRAAEFFIAPDGKDSNAGSKDAPFATVMHAQEAASPGDTVFLRGGTYKISESQIHSKAGVNAHVFDMNKSGTKESPINYFAYQNESPHFDLSDVKPANLRVLVFYVSGNWLHFKGIEVTGTQVTIKTHTQSENFEIQGSNNIFELLKLHDSMAIGVYLLNGSNNLFLNCDAWNNYDPVSETGRGGNVDGFGCHPRPGSVNNIFHGCRAWFNSDDGYDCINSAEAVTFENSWAFYNGFSTEFKSLGDGNGFKAGGYGATPAARMPKPIPRHTVRFCLAVGNKANGFYANHHTGGDDWFNNTAYKNGANFNMLERLMDNVTDVPGTGAKMRNNVGYKGTRELVNLAPEKNDVANNYFNMDLTLTDADFASLDEKQLTAPRQPDGSLPEIAFMHPSKNSQLIGKGVDAGFPFKGDKPDLGAFQVAK